MNKISTKNKYIVRLLFFVIEFITNNATDPSTNSGPLKVMTFSNMGRSKL